MLVPDSLSVCGKWKLAEVCNAVPGSDGKVRDVEVRYKNNDDKATYS